MRNPHLESPSTVASNIKTPHPFTPRTLPLARHEAADTEYLVAPLVYICPTRHGVIILNLQRNRYFALGCSDSLLLSQRVRGFPKRDIWSDVAVDNYTVRSAEQKLFESLLQTGILTKRMAGTEHLVSADVSIDGPLASIGEEIIRKMPIRFRHVAVFLATLFSSWISLRCRSLLSVARAVRRRRTKAAANGYAFNLPRAAAIVDVFRAVRTLHLYSRRALLTTCVNAG